MPASSGSYYTPEKFTETQERAPRRRKEKKPRDRVEDLDDVEEEKDDLQAVHQKILSGKGSNRDFKMVLEGLVSDGESMMSKYD